MVKNLWEALRGSRERGGPGKSRREGLTGIPLPPDEPLPDISMEHEQIRFCPDHVRLDEDRRWPNPVANADEIIGVLAQVPDSDIVLFPELGVTGYTCADLFGQAALLEAAAPGRAADRRGHARACAARRGRAAGRRRATACITAASRSRTGRSSGSSPSSSSRITRSSTRAAGSARPTGASPRRSTSAGRRVPFGIDLLFRGRRRGRGRRRDLRGPLDADPAQLGRRRSPGPTSCSTSRRATRRSARAGYRTELVVGQSGRCIAAYAYASCGAVGIDDRPGLRRALPDRRERPAAEAVAPGRRRRPDRPGLLLHHPGRRRREAPGGPPLDDELRRLP